MIFPISTPKHSLYKFILLGLVSLGLTFMLVGTASAANITWQGDEDNNWSTPGNWSGGVKPGSSDKAVFDGTGNVACNIDETINVQGIDVNVGYTQTITQASGSDITIGNNHFDMDDGDFVGSNNSADDLDMNGNILISAGVNFTAPRGNLYLPYAVTMDGSFSHNSGTVVFDSLGSNTSTDINDVMTFNNLTVDKGSGTYVDMSALTHVVLGTLTLTDGYINSGTIDMRGATTTAGADFIAENGNVNFKFTQGATQTLTIANTDFRYPIEVDKSGGSFELGSNLSSGTDSAADFTLTNGTVNLNGYSMTNTDDIIINGGTFNSGTSDITVQDLRILGGTFNAPNSSGSLKIATRLDAIGTFNHNGGTVTFDQSYKTTSSDINQAVTFNNLVVNKSGGYTHDMSSVTVTVLGTLDLTDGYISSGTIDMQGTTTTIGSGIDNGSADLKFSGSATQTLTINATYFDHKIIVDKSGGSLSFASNWTTVDSAADFVLTNGTVNLGSNTIGVRDDFTVNGGTFNGDSGTLNVQDFYVNGGTFNAPNASGALNIIARMNVNGGAFNHNSGTVTFEQIAFDGVNPVTGSGDIGYAVTFNNLACNKIAAYSLDLSGATVVVEGTFDWNCGYLNSGTLEMRGETMTVGSNATNDGSSNVSFTQGATQTLTVTSSEFRNNIIVNKSGGSFNLGSNLDLGGNTADDFTLTAGTVNLGSYDLSVYDDLAINGGTFNGGSGTISARDLRVNAGTFNSTTGDLKVALQFLMDGTFNHSNGTTILDQSVVSGNADFLDAVTLYNLTINKPGNLVDLSSQIIDVEGTLIMTDGYFNDGTMRPWGNVVVGAAWDTDANATLIFRGDQTQTFDLTGAVSVFNSDIKVNKSGGSVQLLSNLTMNQNDQDLTIVEGTFDLNGYNLDINDQSNSDFDIEDGGALRWGGTETLSVNSGDPTLASGSTVIFDPTSGTVSIPDWSYHHLTIEGGASAVVEIGANESVSGNLTITSGTFYTKDNNLTVGGTFSNDGTLRLQNGGAATLTNDTDSGTVEYVGDGDSNADDIFIDDWTYHNLAINLTDTNDQMVMTGVSGTNTIGNNLWAYWDMEEGTGTNIDDDSANSNVGTLTNSDGDEWVSGSSALSFTSNYALDFDGTNDYVDFNSDVSFIDRSFSFWFRAPDVTTHQMLFEEGGASNGLNAYLTGGKLYFGAWGTSTNDNWFNGSVSTNTWTNVIFVYDSDGNMELFINGVLQGSSVAGGDMAAHSDDDAFGGCTGATQLHDGGSCGNTNYFDGEMDDFRIYERTLTAQEISTLKDGSNDSRTNANITTLNVNGDFILTKGTFNAPATLNVKGNFTGGSDFVHASGDVVFLDNTQTTTVTGDTTFNDLSCATASKAITFTAGSTQTVGGTLTLTGADSSLITLRSSSSGSVWDLNVSGTSSVDYVDVKDSDASSGNAITHAVSADRSTDSGNNTNWGFNDVPTVASVSGVQGTNQSDVTISFIIDDPDDDNTCQAKVEYSDDGGVTWYDPTLSTTSGETTATYGTPVVDNAQTYQVGQGAGYITTSSGANTVTVIWEAETDLSSDANLSNAKVRVTPYDGTVAGSVGTSSSFAIDIASLYASNSPSVYAPTSLVVEDYADGVVKLSWEDSGVGEANEILIHRGVEPYSVSGSAYASVAVNVEYYLDDGVESGDVVTYQIRSRNGNSYSSYTDSVTLTVGDTLPEDIGTSPGNDDPEEEEDPVEEVDEEDTTEDTSSGGSSGGSNVDDEEEEEEEPEGQSLDDLGIDVPDHWSEGYLKNLGEEDRVIEAAVETMSFFEMLVNMFEDPDVGMNRGEALELLLILANYTATETAVNSFDDVDSSHERGYLIEFAADNDLVQGYPDGTFGPENTVNRAEALKMAAYFFDLDVEEVYGQELLDYYGLFSNPFVDVNLESWYAPHVIFAYSNGVVHGYQDGSGRFGPGNDVTYAEFLKIATLMADFENAVELASELE